MRRNEGSRKQLMTKFTVNLQWARRTQSVFRAHRAEMNLRGQRAVFSACSPRMATNYRNRDKSRHVRFIRATHPPPTHVFSRAGRCESRWNRKTSRGHSRGLNRRVAIKPVCRSLRSGKEFVLRCNIIYITLRENFNKHLNACNEIFTKCR